MFSYVPYIFTARPSLPLDCLFAIVLLNCPRSIFRVPVSCPHTQPKVVPVVRTRPERAVTVDVDKLPTEALAEHGIVKSGSAGYLGRIERIRRDVGLNRKSLYGCPRQLWSWFLLRFYFRLCLKLSDKFQELLVGLFFSGKGLFCRLSDGGMGRSNRGCC